MLTVSEPKSRALVEGEPYTVPSDLFIPPDALEVLLDTFTGPLDLLLYLIRQQNIDIMDIPITRITQQYLQYIELMEKTRRDLAADYLLMAAILAEIKSRMLLPPTESVQEQEEDPRMELVRRLQHYEQFKQAANFLEGLPRLERDVFSVRLSVMPLEQALPDVTLAELLAALKQCEQRQGLKGHHAIVREHLSVRERMLEILRGLSDRAALEWTAFLRQKEGRMGLVVTFLALLELERQSLLHLRQERAYAPLHIEARKHG
jgi:segregation and condensation protein A